MSSETFARFQAQLNATGSQKGDGFDGSHFDGLLPGERPEVAQMLRAALLAGDSTAARGLVIFDRSAAPSILREVLPEIPPDSGVRPYIVGQLWELTRDPTYQRELASCLQLAPTGSRMVILSYLKNTPPNPDLAPQLRDYIGRESDPIRRSIAVGLLLYYLGKIPSPDDAYRLEACTMEALRSSDPDIRARAVAPLAPVAVRSAATG